MSNNFSELLSKFTLKHHLAPTSGEMEITNYAKEEQPPLEK